MKLIVTVAFCICLMPAAYAGTGPKQYPSLHAAKERALVWLRNQKVPNADIPDPQPERRNLVVSYEIPKEHPAYRYIHGRSAVYDDALAAIAFTMNGDYKNASQVLLALKRLQRADGGLWFGYNVNNDWPSETDFEGSTERTGASAWAGYAAVFYVKTRLAAEPSALTNRDVKSALDFARSLGDYLLKLQIRTRPDPRYGLVTGGKNTFFLRRGIASVSEVFKAKEIDWISTEHNIDAFFFLRDLALLTKDERYAESAGLIGGSLLGIWSEKDGQYYRGIKPVFPDTALALDCASWGAVFSLSVGRSDYAARSLDALEKLYASRASFRGAEVSGYKPYAAKEIYEDEGGAEIAKFYFPDLGGTTWDRLDGVWVEGSMGAAFAWLKAGRREKAAEILEKVLSLQNGSGGFIYFTREVPHEFSTFVSVASTAWFVMVVSALEDGDTDSRFWGR